MPVYVTRYYQKDRPCTVQYGDDPTLKWAGRCAADRHCEAIRGFDIHVDEHRCDFAVAELGRGEFAIVCATHSRHLRDPKQHFFGE